MSQNKSQKHTKRSKRKPVWPLIVVVAGVLLLLLGANFVYNRSSRPPQPAEVSGLPALKVDKETIDLGDVKLGKTVQASFEITNTGDQTLSFTEEPYIEVKEGC